MGGAFLCCKRPGTGTGGVFAGWNSVPMMGKSLVQILWLAVMLPLGPQSLQELGDLAPSLGQWFINNKQQVVANPNQNFALLC